MSYSPIIKHKGLTLIELLVVVAVVGLLSSIVLVSVSKAKDRANLAKRKAFSQSIKSALGSNIKGEWNFNGNADDSSGSGWTGALLNMELNNEGVEGMGVSGVGGAAGVYDFTLYSIKKPELKDFTYEAWIYPTGWTSPMNFTFFYFNSSGQKIIELAYLSSALKFEICQNSDCSQECILLINKNFNEIFEMNKWNHTAATFNSQKGDEKIYINGILVVPSSLNCSPGNIYNPDSSGYTAISLWGRIDPLNARFDTMRIYNVAF